MKEEEENDGEVNDDEYQEKVTGEDSYGKGENEDGTGEDRDETGEDRDGTAED